MFVNKCPFELNTPRLPPSIRAAVHRRPHWHQSAKQYKCPLGHHNVPQWVRANKAIKALGRQ